MHQTSLAIVSAQDTNGGAYVLKEVKIDIS